MRLYSKTIAILLLLIVSSMTIADYFGYVSSAGSYADRETAGNVHFYIYIYISLYILATI